MPTKQPAKWEVLSEKVHAICKVFKVFEQRTRHPIDKREADFYVIRCNDWLQAIALTPERKLILVNQYRHGSKTLSWEVAGGIMDEDESPEVTAERELLEETGYRGDKVTYLGWCHPNCAIQENKTHFVLVENCVKVAEQNLDPNEELEVKVVPLKQAKRMAREGEITHSIALNALFFLEGHLAKQAVG